MIIVPRGGFHRINTALRLALFQTDGGDGGHHAQTRALIKTPVPVGK
ncbi:MAG: hypothetical protein ABF760_07200 [Zymomonas mobilis]